MYGIKAKVLIYSILCATSNTNREILTQFLLKAFKTSHIFMHKNI